MRFDLEVARRQLVRVKEEKLCQVERIFVVQKIAKLEDDLKVKVRIYSSYFNSFFFKGISEITIRKQETNIRKQSFIQSCDQVIKSIKKNIAAAF